MVKASWPQRVLLFNCCDMVSSFPPVSHLSFLMGECLNATDHKTGHGFKNRANKWRLRTLPAFGGAGTLCLTTAFSACKCLEKLCHAWGNGDCPYNLHQAVLWGMLISVIACGFPTSGIGGRKGGKLFLSSGRERANALSFPRLILG